MKTERKTIFKGSAPALVTPFRDGAVDFEALERLVDFQLRASSDALVVLGTTGEPSTLSAEERFNIASAVCSQVGGAVPVIAGVSGNSTSGACASAESMARAGADALLAVTPYYNKTTQAGLVAHYTAVASTTNLPVMLYNVPARTGLNMAAATVAELAQVPSIVAIKEACGDLGQILELFATCSELIDIYSGNDDQVFSMVTLGAKGVVSVAANLIPKEMHRLAAWSASDRIKEARDLQLALLGFVDALFSEVSPIPAKAGLSAMGLMENELRLPLVPMSAAKQEVLYDEMRRLGLS